jgi:hypothetical protein
MPHTCKPHFNESDIGGLAATMPCGFILFFNYFSDGYAQAHGQGENRWLPQIWQPSIVWQDDAVRLIRIDTGRTDVCQEEFTINFIGR